MTASPEQREEVTINPPDLFSQQMPGAQHREPHKVGKGTRGTVVPRAMAGMGELQEPGSKAPTSRCGCVTQASVFLQPQPEDDPSCSAQGGSGQLAPRILLELGTGDPPKTTQLPLKPWGQYDGASPLSKKSKVGVQGGLLRGVKAHGRCQTQHVTMSPIPLAAARAF